MHIIVTNLELSNNCIATIITSKNEFRRELTSAVNILNSDGTLHTYKQLNILRNKNVTQKNLSKLHDDAIEIFKQQQASTGA
jgi:hypothetical protein